MPFKPTDFTQVNHQINTVLVGRALRLLDVRKDETVIDWFCGLGNFTLPLATMARTVLGIEGSQTLVDRALDNAKLNGLDAHTRFDARNLFELTADDLVALGTVDKWLVDPPREGAFALAKALAELKADPREGWTAPKRIVYVSCNPATLARDTGLLVHRAGYRCVAAGAVNMFPHTAHVESMAVFEWDPDWAAPAEPVEIVEEWRRRRPRDARKSAGAVARGDAGSQSRRVRRGHEKRRPRAPFSSGRDDRSAAIARQRRQDDQQRLEQVVQVDVDVSAAMM